MKQFIIATLVATGALTMSCGNKTQSPSTDQDSAAYAVGVAIGQNVIYRTDSTISPSVIIDAVNDIYNKNTTKLKEAQAYVTAAQIAQQAFNGVDSTFNPSVIAAGITDILAKKAVIKLEEVDQYIMRYVTKAGNKKADDYLAKVDAQADIQKTQSGLRYKIATAGEGVKVASQDTVLVNYTLYDYNDKSLDASANRNEPLRVTMPNGVVPGFAEGLQLLGKGGKATIWMPGSLGYGPNGAGGSIGPNQALKFDIEIVEIIPGPAVADSTATK